MKQTLVKPNIRLSYQGRVRGCKLQCAICYLSTSKLSWRMEDFFSREICVTYIYTHIHIYQPNPQSRFSGNKFVFSFSISSNIVDVI